MKRVVLALCFVCLVPNAVFASRLLRDELAREVTVPDHPHRLVCLAPSLTDTVYAMGRGNDIVGITDFTKYPPEAKQKPSVGGVINPSLEKLVSLKPDLVLAIADLNSSDLVRSIEALGLPVFMVRPQGVSGIYQSIESIGRAIGQEAKARELVAHLRHREQAVRERVLGKKPPIVFFLLWTDPIITAGHGAFISELIKIAGATSATDDLKSEWPRISFEAILQRQPDYLLLVRGSPVTLDILQHQTGWIRLEAVKNGRVFYADDRIDFPSPVAFDALEDLAKQFHPQ